MHTVRLLIWKGRWCCSGGAVWEVLSGRWGGPVQGVGVLSITGGDIIKP